MLTPTRRPSRAASAIVAVGIVAAGTGTASAQWVFNPYMPYNADYVGFTAPMQPNNLALPNAARIASEYNGAPASRFNTFDRWLNDYESDIARGRRETGRDGVDRSDLSRYIPNRVADSQFERNEDRRNREFYDRESQRARIADERDRYYEAARRVSDPARRAAYLKVVARLRDPKTAPAMLAEIEEAKSEAAHAATTARRAQAAAPRSSPDRPRSVLEVSPRPRPRPTTPAPGSAATPARTPAANPAATATIPAAPTATIPAAPTATTPPGGPNRPSTVTLPDQRPPAPTAPRSDRPESAPPPGDPTLPAPSPLPDDLPPPPR